VRESARASHAMTEEDRRLADGDNWEERPQSEEDPY
jgi:hypothetical protein